MRTVNLFHYLEFVHTAGLKRNVRIVEVRDTVSTTNEKNNALNAVEQLFALMADKRSDAGIVEVQVFVAMGIERNIARFVLAARMKSSFFNRSRICSHSKVKYICKECVREEEEVAETLCMIGRG
jgi:hypothetical protein